MRVKGLCADQKRVRVRVCLRGDIPHTLNPNPKPCALNPNPQPLHPKPSTPSEAGICFPKRSCPFLRGYNSVADDRSDFTQSRPLSYTGLYPQNSETGLSVPRRGGLTPNPQPRTLPPKPNTPKRNRTSLWSGSCTGIRSTNFSWHEMPEHDSDRWHELTERPLA